jgi:hypothetical protein
MLFLTDFIIQIYLKQSKLHTSKTTVLKFTRPKQEGSMPECEKCKPRLKKF